MLYKVSGEMGQGRGYGRNDGQNMSTVSWLFNVEIGDPSALIVLRSPQGAFSGGHAFAVQPCIAVVDRGGNVIEDQGDDGNVTVSIVSGPGDLFGDTSVRLFYGAVVLCCVVWSGLLCSALLCSALLIGTTIAVCAAGTAR